MTEVWEEKLKTGSVNIEEEEHHKHSAEKNVEKDSPDAKGRVVENICHLCGRVFKNDRALKVHVRHCNKRKERHEKEGQEGEKGEISGKIEGEIPKLREKLMNEMEAIKEERKKLEEERNAFRMEIRKELEKLREERLGNGMKREHASTPSPGALSEGEIEIIAEEGIEEELLRDRGSGVVVLEAEEAGDEEDIEEMEKELDRIEPEIAGMGKGISALELEELSSELEAIESELNTKVDFAALTKMSEDYESSIKQIKESLTTLDRKVDGVIGEMAESASKYGTYQNVIRELDRLDDKTTEILEEIGFGESLNVAKIPPNILESVYESTMDSVVNEIHRNYGSHDAENIVTRTLEDVRTRTSGSELFYFDGRMLKTRNLAKAIQNKLISAKQVQTTYDELLSKLLEYLPGYKAKNFRAMIKLKSQEYAVDKTTLLLESLDVIKEHIDNLKNMVGSVSNRQNTIEIEINRLSESKVSRADVEQIFTSIEEIKAKQSEFDEVLRSIDEVRKAEKEAFSEAIESISSKLKALEKTPSQEKKMDAAKRPERIEKKREDKKKIVEGLEGELSEDENRILTMIPTKGYTLSRIKKDIGDEMTDESIGECLKSLMNKGIISTVKRGRHTIYVINKPSKGGEK